MEKLTFCADELSVDGLIGKGTRVNETSGYVQEQNIVRAIEISRKS
jgi:hypothetical protein